MRKEPYVIHPKGNFLYKVENTYRNFATARSTLQTIWFLEILIENGIFYIKVFIHFFQISVSAYLAFEQLKPNEIST